MRLLLAGALLILAMTSGSARAQAPEVPPGLGRICSPGGIGSSWTIVTPEKGSDRILDVEFHFSDGSRLQANEATIIKSRSDGGAEIELHGKVRLFVKGCK